MNARSPHGTPSAHRQPLRAPGGAGVLAVNSGSSSLKVALHATEGASGAAELGVLLDKRSGLPGVSETSADTRDLLGSEARDRRAAEAVGLIRQRDVDAIFLTGPGHEDGELGYVLAYAFGATFDNPDLLVPARGTRPAWRAG